MTAELRATAVRWQATGKPAVVVEVLSTRGSVPREAGTRMLVASDAVAGTIGGGHLELQAIADARALLAQGAGAAGRQHIALGPSLGQCCGGVLDLGFTWLGGIDLADSNAWPPELPLFTLQLYGAGHVGRAIVKLLATLHCKVSWIDEREDQFPQAEVLPPHIQPVCVEPVTAEVAAAPAGCCYLVLTHSHDLDLALVTAILQRSDVAWFGLIGSQTKRARFESRLRQRGVDEARLQRMVCPIGLPGIEGKQPEVIAVAVVAQLLLQCAVPAARCLPR
jgi:xanthine dehydrogenase accessory factor